MALRSGWSRFGSEQNGRQGQAGASQAANAPDMLGADQARKGGPMALRVMRLLALALALVSPTQAASPPPVGAAHGIVVTGQHIASDIGVDVLKSG
ncbi:MAG: hypothetical protein JOZ58_02995, partial [Acetobacteraceae bacterium]|nr:hypothetical protein [Acetobacteraceae bacterium]